jgi:hypothetical protein
VLEHDPEKWKPVSRLREAFSNYLRLRLMLWRAKAGPKKILRHHNCQSTDRFFDATYALVTSAFP